MANSEETINSSSSAAEEILPPIRLLVLKWVLVVVHCMFIIGELVSIIMGKSVSSKFDDCDDLTMRVMSGVELLIIGVGLVALIGEKYALVFVFSIGFTIYYIIGLIFYGELSDATLAAFVILWLNASYFYAFKLRCFKRKAKLNDFIAGNATPV